MSPRTGRPTSENTRQSKVETRMNKEELEKLDYCCDITGKTRSEIIRDGIHKVYAELKNLNKK